jgi:hypothetical protein
MKAPDKKTVQVVLAAAKKRPLKSNAIVIARYEWLKKHKLPFPIDMELPILYLKIKDGVLTSSTYNNVLVHVIKKQRYHIQILN